MFIEQAQNARHEFWRYLAGSLVIITFSFVGQIPLGIALVANGGISPAAGDGNKMFDMMNAANMSPNLFTFLLLLSFAFALPGIYIAVKYLHGQSFKSIITTRKKIDWKRFFLSFGIMAVFIIASTLIDYKLNPEDYEINFQLGPFLVLLVMAVILVPIQTSVEELVFRGYLMQGFGFLGKNRWFPLLMTSLIFGGLHLSNPEIAQMGYTLVIYYIGTGLFLGILALMDEGLELSLGFHAANNLIAILLVTSKWSALQSESILRNLTEPSGVSWETFFPLLVIYPLMILLFAKVYRWKDWKHKLFGKLDLPASENRVGPIDWTDFQK